MNMKIEMIGDAQSFTSIKRGLYGAAYSGMSGEDDREILQQLEDRKSTASRQSCAMLRRGTGHALSF